MSSFLAHPVYGLLNNGITFSNLEGPHSWKTQHYVTYNATNYIQIENQMRINVSVQEFAVTYMYIFN